MQLKNPTIFIALILFTAILYLLHKFVFSRKKEKYFVPTLKIAKYSGVLKQKKVGQRIYQILTSIIKALFILTLIILIARPIEKKEISDTKKGIDVVFTIDVSSSMILGKDIEPNRFEASKELIKEFIKRIPENHRVGIVGFSGSALTFSPLSIDHGIIEYTLDNVDDENLIYLIKGQGTAVGDGILLATEKFEKGSDRTKIIVLVTDGESNKGVDVIKAANYAKENKVKIYTILANSDGETDAANELSNIAEITGGKSSIVKDKDAYEQILKDIENAEFKEIKVSTNTIEFDNPDLIFKISAFLLLILILLKIIKVKF